MFAWEKQWHLWRLASPLITRWLLPFSGKDVSCYCPNPGFLHFWIHKTEKMHTQTHTFGERGGPQRKLPRVISFRFIVSLRTSLPNPSVSEFLHSIHGYWIALESPVLHCSSAGHSSQSAQQKNKQQLVGRNSRKTFIVKWREQGCLAGRVLCPLLLWRRSQPACWSGDRSSCQLEPVRASDWVSDTAQTFQSGQAHATFTSLTSATRSFFSCLFFNQTSLWIWTTTMQNIPQFSINSLW